MKIEKVKISEVNNNPNNPRILKDDKFKKLVNSIKEFPKMLEIRPIVVNNEMIVLGGNMRLKACIEAGLKEIHIIKAENLTKKQQDEFIIKDNVSFGDWDWDSIANEWKSDELEEWGMDIFGVEVSDEDIADSFTLPDGDKPPFQQQTYSLADEQAEQISNAITDVKRIEEYKYVETFGNENGNGNALYLIIMQWAEQRK